MSDERTQIPRRRFLRSCLIPPLALATVGCGGPAKRIRRVGLARRLGTTIGRNISDEPAGQSIPASGPGVDLVKASGGQTRIDGALDTAALDQSSRGAQAR